MAKFYYNGVLLPEIPTDVLAECPYCVIYYTSTNALRLASSTSKWFMSDGSLFKEYGTKYTRYKLADDSTSWEFWDTYTDGGNVPFGTLLWSNHDIPNGSADATEIYFHGSDPVPEETEEPETVTQYLIRSDTLTAIADGFRSSRGTTQKYTLDEMAVLAAEKTSGGGSMFASTASGRIPEYEKGTALSEFTLNFETSAVGALQEG